jgi:hypothetical protein
MLRDSYLAGAAPPETVAKTGIVGLLASRGNPKRPATYASVGPSLGSRIACFRTR